MLMFSLVLREAVVSSRRMTVLGIPDDVSFRVRSGASKAAARRAVD
jgi:hypothetical protein